MQFFTVISETADERKAAITKSVAPQILEQQAAARRALESAETAQNRLVAAVGVCQGLRAKKAEALASLARLEELAADIPNAESFAFVALENYQTSNADGTAAERFRVNADYVARLTALAPFIQKYIATQKKAAATLGDELTALCKENGFDADRLPQF